MSDEFRWKWIYEEEPELDEWYLVVTAEWTLSVRYYTTLYTEGLNAKNVISSDYVHDWKWGWEHYECAKQKPFKGFTNSERGGRLYSTCGLYMKIPPLPEQRQVDRYKNKIYELEQKIKRLERAEVLE